MSKRLLLIPMLLFIFITPAMSQQATPDPNIGKTATEFFDWYIDYLETHNYRMDDGYQTNPLLTDGFKADLSAVYESGPIADPVLCAQALPEFYTLEIADYSDVSATVLMRQHFSSPLTHNIEIDMTQSDDAWQISGIRCEDTVTPRGVVQKFYADWIDYAQYDTETETMNNPFVDQIWRESELVTDSFVEKLDALTTSDTPIGHDPVLCAQDVPAYALPLDISLEDGTAYVLVNEFFGDSVVPHRALVTLTSDAHNWYIDTISCDVSPEMVALSFYRLYSDFVRYDMDYGYDRTALFDWGFNWDMFLSDTLKNRLLTLFNDGEPLIADPVLCAQDIPAWVEITTINSTDDGATLQVIGMYASGPDSVTSYPLATVDLVSDLTRWVIDDITCSTED